MKAFGLTGNIGCGKSTVAGLLAGYSDVLVIDCDKISKEIISSGAHTASIEKILGTRFFIEGEPDWKTIANVIFKDASKKKSLENFLHPLVWEAVEQKVTNARDNTICVVESAIIFETKAEDKFEAIIVVACEAETQFQRLREKRSMRDAEIRARLEQQLPSFEKEQRATFIINTNCSFEELGKRVETLYRQLKQRKGSEK